MEEAIGEFQVALRSNPNLAMAHYNLGVAYGQQGGPEEAIQEYQAAAAHAADQVPRPPDRTQHRESRERLLELA